VPILVGSMSLEKEKSYGKVLAPYLVREDTICVVSSDFCHWGTRFDYTYYRAPDEEPVHLNKRTLPSTLQTHPIHKSITDLDHEGMELTSMPQSTPSEALTNFNAYVKQTGNTICGRHPIAVLLGALTTLHEEQGRQVMLKWVRYEQSSQCVGIADSSVSYASAYVTF